MQLLRTILIIVLVYYLFKLFARYVLPLLARYMLRRSVKNYQKRTNPPPRKEGEINIEYKPDKKSASDDLGEYVDYEELND